MKRNENPHKSSYESVTKTDRKKEKKRKQHPELVSTMVIRSNPLSKVNIVGKTEDGDLPSKLKMKEDSLPDSYSGVRRECPEPREGKRTGLTKREESRAKGAELLDGLMRTL
ncbi:unnamed protein product [Hymenolepis diminuta]|uniref:Ovule protein n=1 Tax=Hymenolepis diminuta TaxID=6216 RepID=A0A0R3SGC9_HYMDI|nr:unnamed protein product [Hymenolepis diminuta]VUZ40919.1 unnamed protein product [Hymenolepis diminuta]